MIYLSIHEISLSTVLNISPLSRYDVSLNIINVTSFNNIHDAPLNIINAALHDIWINTICENYDMQSPMHIPYHQSALWMTYQLYSFCTNQNIKNIWMNTFDSGVWINWCGYFAQYWNVEKMTHVDEQNNVNTSLVMFSNHSFNSRDLCLWIRSKSDYQD